MVLVGSFARPNLVYRVRRRHQVARQVRDVVAAHRDEAGIVYCTSRREVEQLAESLGEVPVAVIEKGKTCGAHNVSGAILRPAVMRELLPESITEITD